MPNWVSNELILTGSPKELKIVLRALGDPKAEDEDQRLLDFTRIAPMPNEMAGQAPLKGCGLGHHAGGPMDWRCWREQNWGSKSNARWVSVEGSPTSGSLRYEFSTAWAPARPFVAYIWLSWPGLSIDFTFVEPTMVFAGRDRHFPTSKHWIKANAMHDEALCRAVLGDSRLAPYLDEGGRESRGSDESDDYPALHR